MTSFLLLPAVCLLLCLNLFLAQVERYTKSTMESEFLWAYYLNWCSDVLYICAGESAPSSALRRREWEVISVTGGRIEKKEIEAWQVYMWRGSGVLGKA